MIPVIFHIDPASAFFRKVHAVPSVGDRVFLYEINGPMKVESVTHGVREEKKKGKMQREHTITVKLCPWA